MPTAQRCHTCTGTRRVLISRACRVVEVDDRTACLRRTDARRRSTCAVVRAPPRTQQARRFPGVRAATSRRQVPVRRLRRPRAVRRRAPGAESASGLRCRAPVAARCRRPIRANERSVLRKEDGPGRWRRLVRARLRPRRPRRAAAQSWPCRTRQLRAGRAVPRCGRCIRPGRCRRAVARRSP